MPTDAYVSDNGQWQTVKKIFYRLASVSTIELTIENYLKFKICEEWKISTQTIINFYRIGINRHMIIKLSSLVSLFFLSALQQMVKQITISVPETQFRLIETQRGLISRSKFCQQLLQASLAKEELSN